MYTVAVDIGGTFTDVVAIAGSTGEVRIAKVLTTDDDLIRGIVDGLQQVAEAHGTEVRELLGDCERFVHATTQSSNAIIAYSGARTAVLTTRGFGDTLTIMRATGRVAGLSVWERHHYRMTDKPRPVVGERDIHEVTERVDHRGNVVTPLDEEQVRRMTRELRAAGVEAVAVAFLFSHKNPRHEQRVREIVQQEAPGLYVSLSSEVAPVMGEYERSATAMFNAYVGPVMERYLGRLDAALGDAGLGRRPLIVQANGGVTTVEQTIPIFTVESGPAVGVVGSAHLARLLGHDNVIATDVGGTTFKVALIERGEWSYAPETVLNQYQLRVPMIDVGSIGAGGGSIAWVDGTRLKVGPQSAQAHPGPACYGLGGEQPTVTDADVVLGYISPERFLGGRMQLRADLAHEAIRRHVADPLFGGDVTAAAAGIRQIIDHQMADLIRRFTLERGHDPREFVMIAYGGSGPTHAASYGPEVGVGRIVMPARATVHSAYGAAISSLRYVLQTSEPMVLPGDPARLEQIFGRMEDRGRELLRDAEVPQSRWALSRWAEARYRRQVHMVRIAVPSRLDAAGVARAADTFEAQYERLFGPGSAYREAGIELVNYGVDAVGHTEKPSLPQADASGTTSRPAGSRPTYSPRSRGMVDSAVYDGTTLAPGTEFDGPAVIEHPGTTIVVLEGQRARMDEQGHTHVIIDDL